MDTVYPPARWPSSHTTRGNKLYGPGIADDPSRSCCRAAPLAGTHALSCSSELLKWARGGSGETSALADGSDVVFSCEPTSAKVVPPPEGACCSAPAACASLTMEVEAGLACRRRAGEGRNAIELADPDPQTAGQGRSRNANELDDGAGSCRRSQDSGRAVARTDVRTSGGAEKRCGVQASSASPLRDGDDSPGPAFDGERTGHARSPDELTIYAELDGRPLRLGHRCRLCRALRQAAVIRLRAGRRGLHARDEYIEIDSIVPRLYLMTRMLMTVVGRGIESVSGAARRSKGPRSGRVHFVGDELGRCRGPWRGCARRRRHPWPALGRGDRIVELGGRRAQRSHPGVHSSAPGSSALAPSATEKSGRVSVELVPDSLRRRSSSAAAADRSSARRNRACPDEARCGVRLPTNWRASRRRRSLTTARGSTTSGPARDHVSQNTAAPHPTPPFFPSRPRLRPRSRPGRRPASSATAIGLEGEPRFAWRHSGCEGLDAEPVRPCTSAACGVRRRVRQRRALPRAVVSAAGDPAAVACDEGGRALQFRTQARRAGAQAATARHDLPGWRAYLGAAISRSWSTTTGPRACARATGPG